MGGIGGEGGREKGGEVKESGFLEVALLRGRGEEGLGNGLFLKMHF